MEKRIIKLDTYDGVTLYGACWENVPEETPENGGPRLKGAVLIVHGMSEHSGRYDHFASFLADKGLSVYAFDLRGHGKTGEAARAPGIFAESNGWYKVVEDIELWTGHIRSEHPDYPLFLFGHSMGSFLSRSYASLHGERLAGLVLSGTGGDPGLAATLGLLIARIAVSINGPEAESFLMDQLLFGAYARTVKNRRTRFDWLSRDDKTVDDYMADPLCGRVFTAGFYLDLIRGVRDLHKPANVRKTPLTLPIYLFSGSRDPVGGFSRGVTQVYKTYRKAGVQNLTLKFYSGARHEMLNETNRDEVYRDTPRLDRLEASRGPGGRKRPGELTGPENP